MVGRSDKKIKRLGLLLFSFHSFNVAAVQAIGINQLMLTGLSVG
jgi:hypothetical protein